MDSNPATAPSGFNWGLLDELDSILECNATGGFDDEAQFVAELERLVAHGREVEKAMVAERAKVEDRNWDWRQRHFATEKAWEWLEQGEGRERPEEDRERVAETLRRMDRELLALDRHLELTR